MFCYFAIWEVSLLDQMATLVNSGQSQWSAHLSVRWDVLYCRSHADLQAEDENAKEKEVKCLAEWVRLTIMMSGLILDQSSSAVIASESFVMSLSSPS